MSFCTSNHNRISFTERDLGIIKNSGRISSWRIDAFCPICQEEVKEEEIKSMLEYIYTSEIAKLIFDVYEYRKAYLEAISKLSENGIECPPGLKK